MKSYIYLTIFLSLIILISCGKNDQQQQPQPEINQDLRDKVNAYSPTAIKADLTHLDVKQIALIKKLTESGHLADVIFWKQTSHDAIFVRDSLVELMKTSTSPEIKDLLEYVKINYGPYDIIHGNIRFVGNGPEKRPEGGNYYPIDMTKEEFEKFIKEHPDVKDAFESQYTVIKRDGSNLIAIPFNKEYPEVQKMAKLLEEAAELADNPSLKKYLQLRAKALLTDDYLESDMAWMDIKDSDIDIVIGPIENYEDQLYNYKTAYECVVMVKDIEGTKELEMFKQNIMEFEKRLPFDAKYIRKEVKQDESQLNIVNVVYFGGDCQKGTKTIASSLPNDPRVREAKGGKNNMFKNMMEAKFDKIVVPIAEKILDKSLVSFVDKKAFITFVTLHEVSHTLGRDYVFGKNDLPVRKALKERYSAIEECKADILSMYNHLYLRDMKLISEDFVKKSMVTYLAGLFRSIRFGTESAHGQANLIQLNFLKDKGAITRQTDGTYMVNEAVFFDKVKELANLILVTQAEGDYNAAGKILEKYRNLTPELQKDIDALKSIPRDLNTTYEF